MKKYWKQEIIGIWPIIHYGPRMLKNAPRNSNVIIVVSTCENNHSEISFYVTSYSPHCPCTLGP